MISASLAALAILVLTYVGVAAGGVPGLRLDRAGIAFLGGAAMIALGPLSLDEAFQAIDFSTIALLVGMMIVVAHLKVSGALRALGSLAIEHAHAPFVLLVTVMILAGVLSAFLVKFHRKAPAFVEWHEPDEARVLTSGSVRFVS